MGSLGLLKLADGKIDPYTRFAAGVVIGATMTLSQNLFVRLAGIGIGISGFLQLSNIFKGGKLSFNNSGLPVFVLQESAGVIELIPYETPEFNADGFTVKGLNGVFKLSDGVYGGVNADNSVGCSWGMGSVVNSFRGAGLKSKAWVDAQKDKRWSNLYNASI